MTCERNTLICHCHPSVDLEEQLQRELPNSSRLSRDVMELNAVALV